jgi:hypothetical protein
MTEVTQDEVIEFAQALEQRRGLAIVEAVRTLPIGGHDAQMITAFQAGYQTGYQTACDEIEHRLRTEEWEMCLKPVGAKAVL